MCTIGIILQAAVQIASAAITTKAEHDKKVMGKYQAALMIKDAKNTENNAMYELQEGIEESRRKKLQSILNMGQQKSNIAAGNIALSSQTAINILDDEKLNGELDALNTLKSSQHRAENYFQSADRQYSNAGLRSFQTKQNFKTNTMKIWTNTIGSNAYGIQKGYEWYKGIKEKNKTEEKAGKNGNNA